MSCSFLLTESSLPSFLLAVQHSMEFYLADLWESICFMKEIKHIIIGLNSHVPHNDISVSNKPHTRGWGGSGGGVPENYEGAEGFLSPSDVVAVITS